MSRTTVSVVSCALLAIVCGIGPAACAAEATGDGLQATIKGQAEQIEKLRAENARLAEQVRQLQELCHKAGVNVPGTQPASSPTTQPGTYMYAGKARTQAWFDDMYKQYADKIAMVDSKFYDIGKDVLAPRTLPSGTIVPEVGKYWAAPWQAKILSVINDREILLLDRGSPGDRYNPTVPDKVLHVKGVDAKQMLDGQVFQGFVVCVGTYKYESAGAAQKTVASFALHAPLTKEQFADALASGFKLVAYRTVAGTVGGKQVTTVEASPVP